MENFLPSTYTHFGSQEPVQRTWHEIWSLVTSTNNDIYRFTQLSRQARADGRTDEAARLKAMTPVFETQAFVQQAEQQFGRSRGHIFKSIRELKKQGYIRQRSRGYYEVVASRLKEAGTDKCD